MSAESSSPGTRSTTNRTPLNGGRAVPGKVPRVSLPPAPGLSPLGRIILDKLDRGVVLLDARGAVVDSNALARSVLANGNGVLVRNGRFSFADFDIDARFERLLKSGERSAVADRVIAASVKRPGAVPCRVLVTPVPTVDGLDRGVAFVAVIYAPHETRDISPAVLLELYGLTRAQADVARMLYAGRSVEKTAAELDLSLNTVRTHLKQIFSKCEVQSQAELMHVLALGPQAL